GLRYRGVRAARGEVHLLGPGTHRGDGPPPLRPAPHRVGSAGGARRGAGGVRVLAAVAAGPDRRHHHRLPRQAGDAGPGVAPVSGWIQLLGPALGVATLGAMVLGGDALLPGRGRAWGWFSVAALLALLLVSFVLPPSGSAPHGAYAAGPWTLYLQRVFLCAALLAALGATDWLGLAAGGRPPAAPP